MDQQTTTALLYLDGITVSFDGFRALNELSFIVEPGEMRAIIGPNGAGKTTMMDVVTGKTRPDQGDVYFDGTVDLTKLDEASIASLGIGRKFQKPTVFESHTVWDNLELALAGGRKPFTAIFGSRTAAERARIEEILETVRLAPRRDVRAAGYDGIEIAPFTLGDTPADISPRLRREYQDRISAEGLVFVGLHWLMVSPAGLHVTGPDQSLRQKSWDHVRHLVDLCADLAGSPSSPRVMVFGSPKQRCATGGLTPAEATRNFVEGLAAVAPHAESRGVTILVEALPANQCDVITSLAEAAAVVREINQPSVRTMFDTHNAVDEAEPHEVLVERYFDLIRHVHVNEMNGGYPGTADYNFTTGLTTTVVPLSVSSCYPLG